MNRTIAAAFAFCLLFSSHLLADDFRGTVVASVTVPDPSTSDGTARVSLGYLEIVSIDLVHETRFLQGIEVEFRIPKVVQEYPGSYVFILYKNVKPALDSSVLGYSGEQILMQVPQRISTIVQIPIVDNSTLKSSPYTVLLKEPVKPDDFPLALFVMPVMKGLPTEVEKADFSVRVKPLFTDEGALKLEFAYPEGKEGKPVSTFIDNKKLPGPVDDVVLKSGLHYLKLSSDDFKDEVRTFSIDPGKETELKVALQDITPIIFLEAPENAHVLLDNERLDFPAKTAFQVAAGDHTVVFKVGDYTISRVITVQKAKTYKISLNIQIDVQEN
jgi:5-hydroxyisourate hydrolase-like protein (transthyretin family)